MKENGSVKVSVIIPCYNLGRYLNEAVDSVLAQTYQDFEIIIVDDGSDDPETIRILQNFQKSKAVVFHKENGGASTARNFGIAKSRGEYVCCLDSDDRYHQEFLEKCVALMEDSPEDVGIITTWVQTFEGSTEVWKTSNYQPTLLGFANAIHTASFFRRKAWEDAGGYNNAMKGYEDWDFWIGIVGAGYRWDVIPEKLFYYRIREGSKVTKSNQMQDELYSQIVRGRRSYFGKYYPDILEQFKKNQIEAGNALANLQDVQKQKNQTIFSLTQTMERKDQEIARKDQEIAKGDQEMAQRNQQIAFITSSKFWKLRNFWEGVKWVVANPVKCVRKYL